MGDEWNGTHFAENARLDDYKNDADLAGRRHRRFGRAELPCR